MDLKEKINKIKYSRIDNLSKFIIDRFKHLTNYTNASYPDSIFFMKNNIVFLEYNILDRTLICHSAHFWIYVSVIKSRNGIDRPRFIDIKHYSKDILEINVVNANEVTFNRFKSVWRKIEKVYICQKKINNTNALRF